MDRNGSSLHARRAARRRRKPTCCRSDSSKTLRPALAQLRDWAFESADGALPAIAGALLILLRHEFLGRDGFAITELQHGHRGKLLTSAPINRRRMVAIEFGMGRSGRKGGSSGSVTFGYGKFREQRGGTRS